MHRLPAAGPLFCRPQAEDCGVYRRQQWLAQCRGGGPDGEGRDLVVIPINFADAVTGMLLRLLALLLDLPRARQAAQRLLRRHLGFQTKVQEALSTRIMEDLLALPVAQARVYDLVAQLRHAAGVATKAGPDALRPSMATRAKRVETSWKKYR